MSIGDLAARQHGLLTVAQLRACGVSLPELRSRVRRGEWRRVRPGVIAVVERPSVPRAELSERCLAVLLLLPFGSAVCAATAARLHQLPTLGDDEWLHVLLPPGVRANRPRGVRLHTGPAASVELIDAVPTTDLVRTVIDIAASADLAQAVVTADAAALQAPDVLDASRSCVRRSARRGGRRALAALDVATGRAESPLESIAWVLWHLAGLPPPRQQAVIRRDGRFLARVDFLWAEAMLIVEVDGMEKYAERFALQREKQRQNALVAEGYTVLRFTWADLTVRPELVVRQIAAILGIEFSMEMTTKRAS